MLNKAIFDKVKGTMSKYDIEIEDDIIRKIAYDLKPVYKNYFLTNLPSIKEIESDRINQLEITTYINGIAEGAKKIIKKLEKI